MAPTGRLTRSGVQEQSSRKGQFLKVDMRWSLRYSCQVGGSPGAPMIASPPLRQDDPEHDSKAAGGGAPQSRPGAPRPHAHALARSLLGVDGARRAGKVPPYERLRVAFWEWRARGVLGGVPSAAVSSCCCVWNLPQLLSCPQEGAESGRGWWAGLGCFCKACPLQVPRALRVLPASRFAGSGSASLLLVAVVAVCQIFMNRDKKLDILMMKIGLTPRNPISPINRK